MRSVFTYFCVMLCLVLEGCSTTRGPFDTVVRGEWVNLEGEASRLREEQVRPLLSNFDKLWANQNFEGAAKLVDDSYSRLCVDGKAKPNVLRRGDQQWEERFYDPCKMLEYLRNVAALNSTDDILKKYFRISSKEICMFEGYSTPIPSELLRSDIWELKHHYVPDNIRARCGTLKFGELFSKDGLGSIVGTLGYFLPGKEQNSSDVIAQYMKPITSAFGLQQNEILFSSPKISVWKVDLMAIKRLPKTDKDVYALCIALALRSAGSDFEQILHDPYWLPRAREEFHQKAKKALEIDLQLLKDVGFSDSEIQIVFEWFRDVELRRRIGIIAAIDATFGLSNKTPGNFNQYEGKPGRIPAVIAINNFAIEASIKAGFNINHPFTRYIIASGYNIELWQYLVKAP